jgi:hypothetical protein
MPPLARFEYSFRDLEENPIDSVVFSAHSVE